MKLSVVVPMYNAAQFLNRCLGSVYNQDLSDEEYELILIDDGSPDNSYEVASLLTKDNGNVNIIRQSNKGLGGARNTGIENAKGEYILFLDADDYILPQKLGKLCDIAIGSDLDILEFGAEGVNNEGNVLYKQSKVGLPIPVSGQEYLSLVDYMNSACNKLYSTKLLKNNNLRFLERVYIEDIEFNTRVFLNAPKVMAIPDVCAHFVNTQGSITRSVSIEGQWKMINDLKNVIPLIQNFINENYPKDSPALPILRIRLSDLTLGLLNRAMRFQGMNFSHVDLLTDLKRNQLYPVPHKSKKHSKNLYRMFANQEMIYLSLCRVLNYINSNKKSLVSNKNFTTNT